MKKKYPDDDKSKFWCDNSFQSAATAFFLKIAKSVIVISMTLRYHGNEWDDLPVLFQFSSKNILSDQLLIFTFKSEKAWITFEPVSTAFLFFGCMIL